MPVNIQAYQALGRELGEDVTLVAVSKTRPAAEIKELYDSGHRDFGENYVQELVAKQAELPADIHWHFIGHLQSNKVKQIAAFVHLIHGVDSLNLLREINKQASRNNRVISVLLQMHIAREETKFGLDEDELEKILHADSILAELKNIFVAGLMGMASFTSNQEEVSREFEWLSSLLKKYSSLQLPNLHLQTLSMGMSNDYLLAVKAGSNMVRIGSLIFGERS